MHASFVYLVHEISFFNQLPTAFVLELILTTTKILNLGEARNYADTYKGLWLGG